ncbi:MAG: 2OG-Fe(II) oxygenase [Burkholderiaceae bacterium]
MSAFSSSRRRLRDAVRTPFITASSNQFAFSHGHVARVSLRSELPELALINTFLAPAECASLIDLSESRLLQSCVIDPTSGGLKESASRTSYDVSFASGETALLTTIEERIAFVCNWDLAKSTGIQVIRYLPGQKFSPHFDYLNPNAIGIGVKQRLASVLIYLNDVDAGGATSFPDAGISVSPMAGAALYFAYRTPRRASMTYHSGEPPGHGAVKWLAVKWLTV